jgi:ribosomal subunit interface protein
MTLRVSGKNIDIGESLRSKVQDRVATALAKYFDGSYSGHVTVARDGTGYRTDCVLHLTSGITLEASGSAHDAHLSFDRTADRIEKRLRRYKQRLKERAGPAGDRGGEETDLAEEGSEPAPLDRIANEPEDHLAVLAEEPDDHPAVIAETAELRRLSVSDAVLNLDGADAPLLVFLHAGTGRVNVVYRRRDGAIGWIDPPPAQA